MGLAHGEGPYIAAGVGLLLISSGVSLSVPMGMGHIIDTVAAAGCVNEPAPKNPKTPKPQNPK